MTSSDASRRRGAAAAGIALVCILVVTLLPLRQQVAASAATPLWCLVCGDYGGVDVVLNVLLFIPLGMALRFTGLRGRTAWAAGTAVSLAVETLQFAVVPGRDASLSDLLTNSGGSWIGAAGAIHLTSFLWPSRERARRLALIGAGVWLGLQVGSATLLQPWAPGEPLRADWSRRIPGRPEFDGKVIAALLSGLPVPPGPVSASSPVIRGLRRGVTELELRLTSGQKVAQWSPVFELRSSLGPVVAVHADADNLTFQSPSLSALLRLRRPTLHLSQALGSLTGTAVQLSAGRRNDTLWAVWATGRGRRSALLGLSPSFGWSLLLPFGYAYGSDVRLLTGLWIAGLLAPVAFWWVRSTRGSIPLLVAWAALILAGLGLVPLLFGYPAVHWTEWLAAIAALGLGYTGTRLAAYYGSKCDPPSISESSSY